MTDDFHQIPNNQLKSALKAENKDNTNKKIDEKEQTKSTNNTDQNNN